MRKTQKNNSSTIRNSPFNSALKFLSYRPRSVTEINVYLSKKGYSEEVINESVEKLLEFKFLDDSEFAKSFANNRQLKGKSKKFISYELKNKGVSRGVSEKILSEAKEDLEVAKEYVKKRSLHFEKIDPEKAKKRIINRLRLRGYNWEVINEVLKTIS